MVFLQFFLFGIMKENDGHVNGPCSGLPHPVRSVGRLALETVHHSVHHNQKNMSKLVARLCVVKIPSALIYMDLQDSTVSLVWMLTNQTRTS